MLCCGVSNVDFEQVNAHWLNFKRVFLLQEDKKASFFVCFFEKNYFRYIKNGKTGAKIIVTSL